MDLTNAEPSRSVTCHLQPAWWGPCWILVLTPWGQLPASKAPAAGQVLTSSPGAKLHPRLQTGGQAGGGGPDRGVSLRISCFNLHSGQILHAA